MKLPLLVVTALLLSLVALASAASAHARCTFWVSPTGNGGVVWDTYDHALVTSYDTLCGFTLDTFNNTCHHVLGDTCG